MIRSVGRTGPVKVAGLVAWMLRYDLLATVLLAVAMALLINVLPLQSVAPIVPLLGVVVSIFIGFRNSSAYNRWWEARTLWGVLVGNCRAIGNALITLDDGTPEMAAISDGMRRRQVRHAWELAAELRGVPPVPGVADLTPEDGQVAGSGALLARQAAAVNTLKRAGHIDPQGRVVLVNLNTAQANTAGGLERIRNQPLPAPYAVFIRALAWFFGILVCTRMDPGGHNAVTGVVVSVAIMALFIVAERLGHFIEEPMNNTAFDLPMYRFCAGITADLLGPEHPLARPPDSDRDTVWM